MKFAFIHIPKTAGFYITEYLQKHVLKDYEILNSWELGLDRDWSNDELLAFSDKENVFVHNHLSNWTPHIFKIYQEKNWIVFSFFRHPGDRLCSLFNYLELRMPKDLENMSLEEFILSRISYAPYPAYWEQLNYFDVFSDHSFSRFLKHYFNHSYQPIKKINQSNNLGYDYYCMNGEISKKAQQVITASENFNLYNKLLNSPIIK